MTALLNGLSTHGKVFRFALCSWQYSCSIKYERLTTYKSNWKTMTFLMELMTLMICPVTAELTSSMAVLATTSSSRNGRDILTGGDGADVFYGGFGLNTFEDELDGEIDQLYFRSDQWAENWLYGSAGNSPNGEKADKIEMLDEFDQIYVQGVETSQLSYGFVDHNSNLGETLRASASTPREP